MDDNLVIWASDALRTISDELNDFSAQTSQELAPCGRQLTDKLSQTVTSRPENYSECLSNIVDFAHEQLRSHPHRSVPLCWRRLYTDATLIWSLLDAATPISVVHDGSFWCASISRLDHAIIIAGAAGDGRLDLILDTITRIQSARLPLKAPIDMHDLQAKLTQGAVTTEPATLPRNARKSIPSLTKPPSLISFLETYSKAPFILRGYALDWPAINDNLWSSKSYLQSIAGRGRVVPVEVGNDYRADDWTQKLMPWDEYIDYLFPDESASIPDSPSGMIYLAQHDLFRQFEKLRWDVIVPDYVYMQLPTPEYFPEYSPPHNEVNLVMNAWLGPKKAMSPAHTDPYYNFYTQVVGRKAVWLAPPNASRAMSSYNATSPDPSGLPASDSLRHDANTPRNPATNQLNPMLSNSSRIDVFLDIAFGSELDDALREEYRIFEESVVPHAMSAILGPGDVLFFPPGWWHAMRSEDTSFSVSMWF